MEAADLNAILYTASKTTKIMWQDDNDLKL